jgi:hypothetical protein
MKQLGIANALDGLEYLSIYLFAKPSLTSNIHIQTTALLRTNGCLQG